MLYRNTFPEFLEAISIGPNPSFLENNTDFCEFAKSFPQEVELMYDWKAVKKSSDPLNTLRSFTKKFILYGPDLDVQTLNFFVKKVNVFPAYYSDTVKQEVADAFDAVKNIKTPTEFDATINQKTIANHITYRAAVHEDNNFLNKLAQMLKGCKKPCNYFRPISSSIGTLGDFGRAMSDNATALAAVGQELLHAPVNVATGIANKIKPAVRNEFYRLKIATHDLLTTAVRPFYSPKDVNDVKTNLQKGVGPDSMNPEGIITKRLPLTNDTQTYFATNESHSEILRNIQESLGDCFRMFDYHQRYNPYDPEMNASYAKRKYMGLKNDDVKSLVDIQGSLAPAQFATENTYKNALDVPNQKEVLTAQDTPKAPKYDTYDGPSKGAEQVVTAGTAVSPIQATGSETQPGAGLENIPTNGKTLNFDYGEVKITAYGYAEDECPDSGSEIGLGNSNNMIIPLKTIAVAPETLPATPKNPNGQGLVKRGDVLIITVTDKQGNTWIERRQVGDSSGSGLLKKGGNFKFLIDEFLPTKKGSRLVGRSKDLKLSIQVADTKEPLAKWNPQEASQFAPMFICRTDWLRVKKWAEPATSGFVKAKMDTEYRQYCKWNENDPVKQKIIDSKGC